MTVVVYFATNRNEEGTDQAPNFGPFFHAQGPSYLRFGRAEVEPPSQPGGAYLLTRIEVAPEQNLGAQPNDLARPVLGSVTIFNELRGKMKAQASDLLLLIHGFASDFETAILRAAQIKHLYPPSGSACEVAVFSWPADGTMVPVLSYLSDRDDAKASGPAISRALMKVLEYFRTLGDHGREAYCFQNLHLIAHSMGAYALRNALQSMQSQHAGGGKTLPRIFRNIFLMAPDEDNDAFEFDHKLQRLPEMTEALHVYYSATDGALTISDVTKGNPDRLGTTGPRKLSDLPHKITLIDCRDVADTGSLSEANHQYYRNRSEVLFDIRQVLSGAPSDRIDGRDYIPEKRAYRIRPSRRSG